MKNVAVSNTSGSWCIQTQLYKILNFAGREVSRKYLIVLLKRMYLFMKSIGFIIVYYNFDGIVMGIIVHFFSIPQYAASLIVCTYRHTTVSS